MKPSLTAFAAGLLFAGAVMAHTGVKDPAVKARMDSMGILAAKTKVLGQMARGVTPYDSTRAAAAIAAMQIEAARTAELFETRANDPTSEALPAVWDNRDRFVALAANMVSVLDAADVSTEARLKAAVRELAATCKACHAEFRE